MTSDSKGDATCDFMHICITTPHSDQAWKIMIASIRSAWVSSKLKTDLSKVTKLIKHILVFLYLICEPNNAT